MWSRAFAKSIAAGGEPRDDDERQGLAMGIAGAGNSGTVLSTLSAMFTVVADTHNGIPDAALTDRTPIETGALIEA